MLVPLPLAPVALVVVAPLVALVAAPVALLSPPAPVVVDPAPVEAPAVPPLVGPDNPSVLLAPSAQAVASTERTTMDDQRVTLRMTEFPFRIHTTTVDAFA